MARIHGQIDDSHCGSQLIEPSGLIAECGEFNRTAVGANGSPVTRNLPGVHVCRHRGGFGVFDTRGSVFFA